TDGPFQFMTVGNLAGSNGTYTVQNGAASSSMGALVGRLGTGRMQITSGATFSTTDPGTGNLIVGDQPGGVGDLLVTGPGTRVTAARQPIVGNAGKGTATISGGARVDSSRLLVGISATIGGVTTGGDGTVNIDGAGTLLLLKGQSPFISEGVFLNN